MADEIVSTVTLEGGDQVVNESSRVASAVSKDMQQIAGSTAPVNKEMEAVGKSVEAAANKFTFSVKTMGRSAAAMVTNVSRMGASVARFASIMGLGVAALSRLGGANRDVADDTKAAIAANRLQSQSMAGVEERALSNAQALRDLTAEFAAGKLSTQEFGKAYNALIVKQQEEEANARRLELIRSREQEQRLIQEAAIKKEAAAQELLAANTRRFGADAAGAMESFGRAWESFMTQFNQGPSVIGDIFRGITSLLQQNGTEIIAIFARVGAAFQNLFKDQTGQGSFGESFMKFLRTAETVIVGAFIPALRMISTVLQPVADLFNSVFGTQLTGGIVAVGIALGVMSGAFSLLGSTIMVAVNAAGLLFKVIQGLSGVTGLAALFTPWGIAIAAIIVAIGLLIYNWDLVKKSVNDVITFVSGLLTKWGEDFNASVKQFKDAWSTVEGWWNTLWTGLDQTVQDTQTRWGADWDASIQQFKDAWEGVKNWWNNLWGGAAAPGGAGAGGGPEGLRRGGMIRGPGTSTSDSVPIWGSRGEWVIQAKAVQHYGRSFMAALNSMRLPRGGLDLSSFGDALAPAPARSRFATGGEIRRGDGGRPIILQFPDGQTFKMNAASETADHLGRYATSRRLAGAGRKPSYYGGGR
jgi:hypothetical protein